MGVKQLKVDVNDVTIGMFVAGLDRPFSQTPFPLQGFYIRDAEEIKELRTHCRFVFIDTSRGSGLLLDQYKKLAQGTKAPKSERKLPTAKMRGEVAALRIRRGAYPVTRSLADEMPTAKQLYQVALQLLDKMAARVEAGMSLPAVETREIGARIADSVLRNPDAFTWLARLPQSSDKPQYRPILRSLVWALVFARHLGMAKKDLEYLASAMLLKDVGKLKLPPELLANLDRSVAEERQFEKFVEISADLVRASDGIEPRVVAVVKSHCERVNGSGYPNQLQGDKIPLLARIAGIVTFYDDSVHPADSREPLPPSKAVALLYDRRDEEFQEELVVEFIRAIGLYPTGTVVELNTGKVAVVIEQNFTRRLKPLVAVVMNADREIMSRCQALDLAEDDQRKQALVDSGKKRLEEVSKLEITQDIDATQYGFNLQTVLETTLGNRSKKKKSGFLSFLRR